MNIFNALSQGDGSISETNITSFLSYVFNENVSFGAPLLILFLDLVNENLNSIDLKDILEIRGESIRERISYFGRHYSFSAIAEQKLYKGDKHVKLDNLLTVSKKSNDQVVCYFLIENKIKKTAFDKEQLSKQYEFFLSNDSSVENLPIISILISPNHTKFSEMYEEGKRLNSKTIWLKWLEDERGGVVEIFKELIQLEQDCELSPIEDQTKYILKSFIDFLSILFAKNSKSGTYSYGVDGFGVIDQAEFKSGGKAFSLRRFSNQSIRIFDSYDDEIKGNVLPVLRSLIEQEALNVALTYSTGTKKNTRQLGAEIINVLNGKVD